MSRKLQQGRMATKKMPGHLLPAAVPQAMRTAVQYQRTGKLDQAAAWYEAVLAVAPQQPDAHHNLGLLHIQRGQPKASLNGLRQALHLVPSNAQYWLSLVDALLLCGEPEDAARLLAEVMRRGVPGDAVSALIDRVEQQIQGPVTQYGLLHLEAICAADELLTVAARIEYWAGCSPGLCRYQGLGWMMKGDNDAALPLLQRAVAGTPEDVNAWNQLGIVLNRLGQFEAAQDAYQRALQLAPNSALVMANIGASFNDSGNFVLAEQWLRRALALGQEAAVKVNLVSALFGLARKDEALILVREVIAVEPDPVPPGERELYASAHMQLGELLSDLGDEPEALAHFRKAAQLNPASPKPFLSQGHLLTDAGDFVGAETMYREVLRRDAEHPEGWAALASLRKMTAADTDWLATAERIVARGLPPQRELVLRFAMGKYWDDLRQYDAAFSNYARANQLKKAYIKPFDRDNIAGVIDAIIEHYTPARVQHVWPGASDDERPLFILGMPRSGTSLTEQILASHPDTFGAGELPFWVQKAEPYKRALLSAEFAREELECLAKDCLSNLARFDGQSLRVIDKMPGNFMYLGMIHAVFPHARFLHTMRNPLDTCLSIYFQNFAAEHGYASDLEDLAFFYRQYHRLMAHWRQVMPKDRFLELPYEQLVEDQEGWSRKIIDFIGLPWDERCLEFYKTDRKVGTASNWQARQPIYKTSKERWRNYEPHVGPLLPLLELYDPERGQI